MHLVELIEPARTMEHTVTPIVNGIGYTGMEKDLQEGNTPVRNGPSVKPHALVWEREMKEKHSDKAFYQQAIQDGPSV